MSIRLYVITLKGDPQSEKGYAHLESTIPQNAHVHRFDAVVPKRVSVLSRTHKIEWKYPWSGEEMDLKSGLIKRAYPTKEPNKRIACFLSHYLLWKRCIELDEPIIIHEHDACYFNNSELPLDQFNKSYYDIIGLNDPSRATRLASLYHEKVQESEGNIVRAPIIDQHMVPQGIAGNSSYHIKPRGAREMVSLTKQYGAWPNDALMCRQLVSRLGQSKKYYTYVQGLESTTSL